MTKPLPDSRSNRFDDCFQLRQNIDNRQQGGHPTNEAKLFVHVTRTSSHDLQLCVSGARTFNYGFHRRLVGNDERGVPCAAARRRNVDFSGYIRYSEWPLARQQWRTLHLDASSNTLSDKVPAQESVARYQGDDLTSSVKFAYRAEKDTEISGYLNLHLWVETEDADDADLFAVVYKTDAQGRRLYHVTVAGEQRAGLTAAAAQGATLPAMVAYSGPLGRIRASHRALDPERSTPSEPYLLHTEEDLLTPGEPVAVELGLWPTSMMLRAGETLVVEIAGHPVGDLAADSLPGGDLGTPTRNKGAHLIRTGDAYDSHLLLPVVP